MSALKNETTPTHLPQIDKQHWSATEATKYERIHTEVFDDPVVASQVIAQEIAHLIRQKQAQGAPCVLGLATGSSPIAVYAELVRLHRSEGLSFKNVVSFNLDEYYGLDHSDAQSYIHFMHHHLFDHVDILPENIHVPNGKVAFDGMTAYCMQYEEAIKRHGGIDFQLLGIGRTGHIGFNEPGSKQRSITRMITLDHLTRQDNAFAFDSLAEVPKKAITMGVGTILSAKRIVIMAYGAKKADIVQRTIEGQATTDVPASFLQAHENVTFVLDTTAASHLTRLETPWVVGDCDWSEDLTRKAIVWLSQKRHKPILKLTRPRL